MSAGEQASVAEQVPPGRPAVASERTSGPASSSGSLRLCRAEIEAGRGVDAILDLIRGAEKVISAALGPHQAKAFLQRVQQLIKA
jgi:hypothetical protein